MTIPDILIIGAGKVGTSLFRALSVLNNKTFLYGRKTIGSAFARYENIVYSLSQNIIAQTDIIIITVNDGSIKSVVEEISYFSLKMKIIVHTSGNMNSSVISSVIKQDVISGCFHPMQTFSSRFAHPKIWQDIFCSYEGDKAGYDSISTILKEIGCRTAFVTKKQKQALHIAAVFVSNYMVSLFAAAEDVAGEQIDNYDIQDIMRPIVRRTIDNYLQKPLKRILSGPLQRGDLSTISEHLDFLNNIDDRELENIYRLLGRRLLKHDEFPIINRNESGELLEK